MKRKSHWKERVDEKKNSVEKTWLVTFILVTIIYYMIYSMPYFTVIKFSFNIPM